MIVRAIALFLSLLAAAPAQAAVAYVTQVTATETGQDGSISLSIDVGSGANRLLACGAHFNAGDTNSITGITHNGVPLTQSLVGKITTSTYSIDVWYLVAPASGSQTVQATINTTGSNKTLGCIALTGVDQSSPLGTGASFSASTNPMTATITVPANGVGLAFATNGDEATCGSFTADGSSTERYDLCDTDANFAAMASTKETAETAAMTFSNVAEDFGAMIALPVNPAGAAATGLLSRRRY